MKSLLSHAHHHTVLPARHLPLFLFLLILFFHCRRPLPVWVGGIIPCPPLLSFCSSSLRLRRAPPRAKTPHARAPAASALTPKQHATPCGEPLRAAASAASVARALVAPLMNRGSEQFHADMLHRCRYFQTRLPPRMPPRQRLRRLRDDIECCALPRVV